MVEVDRIEADGEVDPDSADFTAAAASDDDRSMWVTETAGKSRASASGASVVKGLGLGGGEHDGSRKDSESDTFDGDEAPE